MDAHDIRSAKERGKCSGMCGRSFSTVFCYPQSPTDNRCQSDNVMRALTESIEQCIRTPTIYGESKYLTAIHSLSPIYCNLPSGCFMPLQLQILSVIEASLQVDPLLFLFPRKGRNRFSLIIIGRLSELARFISVFLARMDQPEIPAKLTHPANASVEIETRTVSIPDTDNFHIKC